MGRKHNLIILSSVLLFIFMFNRNLNLFLQEIKVPFNKQNVKDLNIKFPFASNSVVLEWSRTWGGSDYDIGREIALDSSNNILIAGYTRINNPEFYDIALVKYNSIGVQLWNKTWGRSDRDDHGYGVALDSSENIYIVGTKVI